MADELDYDSPPSAAGGVAGTRTLALSRGGPTSVAAFAIGHGGTGAAAWQQAAPVMAGIEFQAIRLPGRESRIAEPLLSDLVAVAADTARTVVGNLIANQSFALIGACYGAVVAYECARQLCRAGLRPRLLVVIDAPYGRSAADCFDPQQHEDFAAFAARNSLLPPWVWDSPEILQMLLSRLHADVLAHTGYRWQVPEEDIADRVVAVTGRRLSVQEATQWAVSGRELHIVDTGLKPRCMLDQEPGPVGTILESVLSALVSDPSHTLTPGGHP